MIRAAVFNDTRPTNHHGCQLVMKALVDGLLSAGINPVWFHPVREDWRERPDLPGPEDVDLVIVNGEGSIHHSATRPRAVFLSQIGPWAKARGLPAYLINSTIQDIDGPVAAAIGDFTGVYVRESTSQDELSAWGVSSLVCPDLTVALEAVTGARSGVCVTDSVLKVPNRFLRALSAERGWEYRRMIVREPVDADAALRAAHDFTSWITSHSLVVTGRFHTVTLCIATGTPVVAVESNTTKISAFLADGLGDTRRVLSLDELRVLDPGKWTWSDVELTRIRDARDNAKVCQQRMFREIAQSAYFERGMIVAPKAKGGFLTQPLSHGRPWRAWRLFR